MDMRWFQGWVGCGLLWGILSSVAQASDDPLPRSHQAERAIYQPSKRPLPEGNLRFVDAKHGDDRATGTKDSPWKTVARATERLRPGDVIVLREGTYYEQVRLDIEATEALPVILRGYPNEQAIIDAGFSEFFSNSREAWEPVPDGAPHEFRGTRKYPGLKRVVGNFGDSLLPLHAYRFAADLRAENEAPLPTSDNKVENPPCYYGPGVWYDEATERIHIRLSHTHLPAFKSKNYAGVTNPRGLPLVIAGWDQAPLTLENAKHVRIQDLTLRGGGDNTLLIRGCEQITLEKLTLFVANRGIRVETTGHLLLTNCWLRGTMPPWGSRTVSKYRATDSHLFVPVGTKEIEVEKRAYFEPQCHDFEIAHCEFTDGHDGVYVGGVHRLKFHHNQVDNMNDDGVYLSAWGPAGSEVEIYQNEITRCLTAFAFGLGRGQESPPGSGTSIYRNLIDLRQPAMYRHPLPEDNAITSYGRLCGDHGGPVWEPLRFYHNTVLTHDAAFRGAYAAGWGSSMRGTKRAVFNNLFVQEQGLPGLAINVSEGDVFEADGNLHWSYDATSHQTADFFAPLRRISGQSESKRLSSPPWGTHDLFADPKFVQVNREVTPQKTVKVMDLRLSPESTAVNAGVPIPPEWPDPFRETDEGRPDIGAVPLGYVKPVRKAGY